MVAAVEDFDHEDSGADDDGAIGQVESGPVVGAEVEVEEVNHAAAAQAVEKISEGAAQNQTQTPTGEVGRRSPPQQDQNQDQGREREADEKDEDDDGFYVGKEAKGSATVAQVGEVEEAGEDGPGLAPGQSPHDGRLGELVEQKDDDGERKVKSTGGPVHGGGHGIHVFRAKASKTG